MLAVAVFWLSLAVGRAGASRLLGRGTVPAALLARALLGATLLLAFSAVLNGPARMFALAGALVCAGPVYSLVLAQADSSDDTRGLLCWSARAPLGAPR